ncbi:MAG TPA: hypothetical protein VJS66_02075 [Burkholderiales bacterium]|nr:hypothetical protein [Burkholderiales bacterium]
MMQQVNLYRPIFRKQEKKFSAVAMLQASTAMLAGVVVIYALMYWQVHGLRNEIKEADKRFASANKRMDDAIKQLGTDSGKPVEEEIVQLEQQVAARLRVREALNRGLFSNTAGYSDFFVAFARQHVPSVWITGFNIVGAGEDMRMQGRTTDPAQVPRYMQRLSTETKIAGKEFQVFVMSKPDKKEGQVGESYIEFLFRTTPSKEQRKS